MLIGPSWYSVQGTEYPWPWFERQMYFAVAISGFVRTLTVHPHFSFTATSLGAAFVTR
jgi:hypothetical protein